MKKRVELIIAVLALTGVCWARPVQEDPLQKKITFAVHATTMKNLMPILQKETGIAFNVTPQTANDVLLVSVKDVTVQQLMEKIAQASDAEWVKDSTGYRLSRSQGLSNTQERKYLNARAAAMTDAISKLKAPAGSTSSEAKGEQIVSSTMKIENENGLQEYRLPPPPKLGETPVGRALIAVLSRMNVNDIAAMGEGTRVVYASAPTRVQRAMPGAALRELQNFAAEHQAYVLKQKQAQTEVMPGKFLFLGPGGQTSNEIKGGISKILLVLQRFEDSDDVQAQILVADQEGNIAASASTMISGRIEDKSKPLTVDSSEKPIELSDEAKLHAQLMGTTASNDNVHFTFSSGGGGTFVTEAIGIKLVESEPAQGFQPKVKPTPELLAKILEPEKYDPLSFAVSEFLSGMANGQNIVASIPDSLLIPLSRRAVINTRPTELRNILSSTLKMETETKDGWMVVTPRFSPLARLDRADRLPAGQLLRSVKNRPTLPLDEAAEYASRHGAPLQRDGFEIPYLNVVNKTAGGYLSGQSPYNWNLLKLYGSMNPQQRRDMLTAGRVRASNLNPFQMGILDRMVYDDVSGPRYINPNPPAPPRQGKSEEAVFVTMANLGGGMSGFMGMGPTKLLDERTEFMPTGVPRDAMINLSISNDEGVYASNADGSESKFMSAEEYAMQSWIASQGNLQGPVSMPKYEKFVPATMSRLNFEFLFSPIAAMSRSLEDNRIEGSGSLMQYEQLPATFRERVQKMLENLNSKPGRGGENVKVTVGGGGNKPPRVS
ncbi:MAG: hypothetical protein KF784_09715 [Fimbriimonadaceae bacterium]|nr:hypothetical protein [Fimbriimonadaceae bacterium]